MDRKEAIEFVNAIEKQARERVEASVKEKPDFPFHSAAASDCYDGDKIQAIVKLVSKPRSTETTFRTGFKIGENTSYGDRHAEVIGRAALIDYLSAK